MLMAASQSETSIIISMRLHTQPSLSQVPHALCRTVSAVSMSYLCPVLGRCG